jgi:hypothetical protein
MKLKKVLVGRAKSSSHPDVVHKQYRVGKSLTCSCIGFKIRKNCIHIKKLKGETTMSKTKSSSNRSSASSSTSSKSSAKLAAVRGKTTRATMINLLLKNKGKTVSISAIKHAVKKLGFTDAKVAKRIKQKTAQVALWAKQRNLKLVVKSDGMKLAA